MSKAKPNRSRNNLIKVYLSDEEYRRFRENVKACKRTNSSYLRELIIETTPAAFPPAEYSQVIWELQKIGVNMNQIASKAHSLGFVDDREYQANADKIWRCVASLSEQLVTILRAYSIDRRDHDFRGDWLREESLRFVLREI